MKYIYQNQLDKACFQHDSAYGDLDLARRIASDKVSRDKAFILARNSKNNGYQHGLASIVYKLMKSLQVVVLKVKLFGTNN